MMGQEHLRNIALIEGAEVTAVYDPVDDLARHAAELAGGATVTESLGDLLARDLDALVVVSPNHCHVPQLQEIAATRPLPLLMEKPLFTREEDRKALETLDYPAPVWVAMEYRYMPPVAALIEEAEAATGGVRMLTIREHRFPFLPKVGNWNRFNAQTGGTLVEKCCHFFDLMRLILKAEPVRVFASGAGGVNHGAEIVEGRVPDILDHAFVIVEFDSGARAMLDLCMFAEGSYWQEVISATGELARIDAMIPGPARFAPGGKERASQLVISNRGTKMEEVREIHVDETILGAGDHHGSTFFQHEKFARMVREGGVPEVSLRDGLIAVAVGAAAEESVRTGLPVTLDLTRLRNVA